jgi:hypothetical protein
MVPANAGAVVFSSQAELLASLAGDFLTGDRLLRWWWQALFPGRTMFEALCTVLRESPQHVPSALECLLEKGEAERVLRILPEAVVRTVLANVARAFAADELAQAIQAAVTTSVNESLSFGGDQPVAASKFTSQWQRATPWSRWLDEDPSLTIAAQTLLVVSVALRRAPEESRSALFLQRVWSLSAPRQTVSAGTNVIRAPANRAAAKTNTKQFPVVGPWLEKTSSSEGVSSLPRFPQSRDAGLEATAKPPGIDEYYRGISQPCRREPTQETPAPRQTTTSELSASTKSSSQGDDWTTVTSWGGVFYMINVGISLGLYGDFTQPRHPSLPLPLWDFLALLGARFNGNSFEVDACWPALARLSGRPTDTLPGRLFDPPQDWRMPEAWLTPFPERARWRAELSAGRLRLSHPAGFAALDVACEPNNVEVTLQRECERLQLAEVGRAQRWSEEGGGTHVDHWLTWICPYIFARLRRSLNKPDETVLRELVFHHEARLRCMEDRLQVHFSLAAHPVELRLAGLDRDPGWVPAAGRTITFHYA